MQVLCIAHSHCHGNPRAGARGFAGVCEGGGGGRPRVVLRARGLRPVPRKAQRSVLNAARGKGQFPWGLRPRGLRACISGIAPGGLCVCGLILHSGGFPSMRALGRFGSGCSNRNSHDRKWRPSVVELS